MINALREIMHKELDVLIDAALKRSDVSAIMDLMVVNTVCMDDDAETCIQNEYAATFCEREDGSFVLDERALRKRRWYWDLSTGTQQTAPLEWYGIEDNGDIQEKRVPTSVIESAQMQADLLGLKVYISLNADGSWRCCNENGSIENVVVLYTVHPAIK